MKNLLACVGYECGAGNDYKPYSPNNNNNNSHNNISNINHHISQQQQQQQPSSCKDSNTPNKYTNMQSRSISRRSDCDSNNNNSGLVRSRSAENTTMTMTGSNEEEQQQQPDQQQYQRAISDYLDAQEEEQLDDDDIDDDDIDDDEENILVVCTTKDNNNNNNKDDQLNETSTEDETLSAYSSANESSSQQQQYQQQQQQQQEKHYNYHVDDHTILPTLLRYPVSVLRNKNCWSESPVSIYSVRSTSYFTNKKKVMSAPYLFQARGSDIFLFTDNNNTVDSMDFSKMSHSILGGQLRKKPTFAINFRFPWGYMNLYFEIAAHMVQYLTSKDDAKEAPIHPMMDPKLSPAEKTLAAWLLGDTQYKNERLKLIAYVAEGPWVVRNMVTGRPALIGKKLPVSYEYSPPTGGGGGGGGGAAPLLTATLDIGSSSTTAKRIVSVCRRYMSALTVDIGFVIQGETPTELPEQMLGSVRVHGPDPLKAPKIGGGGSGSGGQRK